MNLIDALLGEHAVLYALFDLIEKADSSPGRPDPLPGLLVSLSESLLSHAGLEDELLFPALETRIGPMGPLAVMRAEHEEIEGALGDAGRSEDPARAVRLARSAVAAARQHFAKEEQVLFPMARRALGEEELARLAERWSAMRKVSVR